MVEDHVLAQILIREVARRIVVLLCTSVQSIIPMPFMIEIIAAKPTKDHLANAKSVLIMMDALIILQGIVYGPLGEDIHHAVEPVAMEIRRGQEPFYIKQGMVGRVLVTVARPRVAIWGDAKNGRGFVWHVIIGLVLAVSVVVEVMDAQNVTVVGVAKLVVK